MTLAWDDAPSPELTQRIAALHAALGRETPPGVIECVPGLASLLVLFDPLRTDVAALAATLRSLERTPAGPCVARRWRLPVCYEGAHAPDLESAARALGLTPGALVEAHSAREYSVYVVGFSPGFPYLGDLDPQLELPRRAEPRPRVPAGSVAIATRFTAVYPQATAGGWHLIGACPVSLFDPAHPRPALLAAGDRVRFEPVGVDAFDALRAADRTGRRIAPS